MLINTIPIIALDEFRNNKNIFGNSTVGICVNFSQLYTQETIEFLFKNNFSHFICIDLLEDKTFIETNLVVNTRQIILLCYNINYYKVNDNPVIAILLNKNNPAPDNIITKIKNEFLKQGYNGINIFELNSNNIILAESDCFFTSNELKEKETENLYNLMYYEQITDKPYFIFSSFNNLNFIKKQIVKIEESFEKNEPNLYNLHKTIQLLKANKKFLENENLQLRTKNDNAEMYLKLIRIDADKIIKWYKEEIEKILNWYHKEYEALPLWYKRIGHVIKRFTNKNGRIKH
jgi:hypothetical protein